MPQPESPTPTGGDGRLLVASNRLPVRLEMQPDGWQATPSSGGLASALDGVRRDTELLWIGWPGTPVPPADRAEVTAKMAAEGLAPVFLSATQEEHFYRGICNEVLWPLFHYFTDRVAFAAESWRHYVEVNELFARRILEEWRPGDRIWIHDLHLMLVPRLLREARPDLEIGFFLHIPFPSSEIYRLLPTREDLLLGVLGADLVSFHTAEYARHFRSACLRILGLESHADHVLHEGRLVGVAAHPIGIDTDHFAALSGRPRTLEYGEELRRRFLGRKVILGVERLDYSKGIPLKLQAFERFLEREPARAKDYVLLQVLVPSRLNHPDYQHLKDEIEQTIGRLNGRFARPGLTPVEYLHRNLTQEQLVALYRFADAALITPIRDGMNLIAQEFVLCRDGDGTASAPRLPASVVLSEFAGAAIELTGALLVNPWDVEQTADAIEEAFDMPAEEQEQRLAPMIERVRELDCRIWAKRFVARLTETVARSQARHRRRLLDGDGIEEQAAAFAAADRRLLILDYDGTLREFTKRPEDARPTPEILDLLRTLAALPDTEVHLVSGRRHQDLEGWFADLPVHLCAEHGGMVREGDRWILPRHVDLHWLPQARALMKPLVDKLPGSMIEEKTCAIAWHYRNLGVENPDWHAREVHNALELDLSGEPVQVLHGHKVIEVRARTVNKGSYVAGLVDADAGEEAPFVVCIGDDRTDEDMYRVLGEDALTVHVGRGSEHARYRVETPAKVRALLTQLAAAAHGAHA